MLLWQSGGTQTNYNFNNTGSFSIPFATWTHVVCVMTRATRRQDVYVNGSLSSGGSGTFSAGWGVPASTTSISALSIGRSISTGHRSFHGLITDYRLYPRALTAPQISAIFAGAV